MTKNQFVRSETGYSAAITKECFNEIRYNFQDYFVKHYIGYNRDEVYHIIIKEDNLLNSGITLYEFVRKDQIQFLYYSFGFDLYNLFFPNTERIIKDICIKSNGLNFLYKVPEYEEYFKSTIQTQDETILGFFNLIKSMPVGTKIAFEQKEFLKEDSDTISSYNIQTQQPGE